MCKRSTGAPVQLHTYIRKGTGWNIFLPIIRRNKFNSLQSYAQRVHKNNRNDPRLPAQVKRAMHGENPGGLPIPLNRSQLPSFVFLLNKGNFSISAVSLGDLNAKERRVGWVSLWTGVVIVLMSRGRMSGVGLQCK